MVHAALVCWLLAQAPDAGAALAVQVDEDPVQGEQTLAVGLSPLAQVGAVRLLLTPSWGAARSADFVPVGAAEGVVAEVEKLIDAGPATFVVLTVDTRLALEVPQRVVELVVAHGLLPELRFAGPTKLPGKQMPEVLALSKLVPVAPALTRGQIRGVLQGAYGEVRGCYARQLQANALEGRLVVEFQVQADGAVASAKVRESGLSAPDVDRCVVEVVKALRFPKLRGMQSVSLVWPFVFKKGADRPAPAVIPR